MSEHRESPAPHPGSAERLHEYWVHGEGAARIRWGTPGDFDRCTRQLEEHAHFTPEQAHGYCNLAHHAATGMYPSQHAELIHKGKKRSMADAATDMAHAADEQMEDQLAALLTGMTPQEIEDLERLAGQVSTEMGY